MANASNGQTPSEFRKPFCVVPRKPLILRGRRRESSYFDALFFGSSKIWLAFTLLAAAGGESPPVAAVWPDAAADLGAADAIGLAFGLRLHNPEPNEEGRHSV